MLKAVSSTTNAIGAVNYKGTWDANTNSPLIASGIGTKGDYYVVGTAGTTTIDGISTWYVGDWIVFNGTTWQRVQGGSDDPAPSLLSNSTTGLMQITGPAAGTTRVVTIPNANSTMARTDAAQSFTGDQTLATGNIIQGTAAKGVNFTANTPVAGMTSQLMNWYEEGTWTGTMTGSVSNPTTSVTATGRYTRIGRTVHFQISFNDVNTTGAAGHVKVTGLPFTSRGTRTVHTTALYQFDMNTGTSVFALLIEDDTVLSFYASKDDVDWQQILHSPGTSRYLTVSGVYTTN